jgi:hypothetical protein
MFEVTIPYLGGILMSSSQAVLLHWLGSISSRYDFAFGDNFAIVPIIFAETRLENVFDNEYTCLATFFPANFSVFLAM